MNEQEGPIAKFHAAHGNDYVCDGNWCIFRDGACRERSAYGQMRPPPENPRERGKLLVRYWGIRTELAVQEFDDRKTALLAEARNQLEQPGNVGGPAHDVEKACAELNELKKKVTTCRAELERVQAEVEAAQPEKRQQADIEQQNRARLQAFARAVKAIET